MGPFKKCDDPLVTAVRNKYQANPIRMPRCDIAPLCLIASNRRYSDFLGPLQPLLLGKDPVSVTLHHDPAPSGLIKESRAVSLDLGLDLLGGFLAAWGVHSADIGAKFKGASKVTFRFDKVSRVFVNPTDLSAAMEGRRISTSNPLISNLLGKKAWGFYIIDATITSSVFTIRVEEAQKGDFSLSVPAVQEIVGKAHAKIGIESEDSREITFKGECGMPFAFSCQQFKFNALGEIESIMLHENIPSLGFEPEKDASSSKRVLLTDQPGLLNLNFVGPDL
ncbi:MAG: hypothetical protein WAN11_20150 [Syntrophobacteraceae bacterium]